MGVESKAMLQEKTKMKQDLHFSPLKIVIEFFNRKIYVILKKKTFLMMLQISNDRLCSGASSVSHEDSSP